MTCEKPQIHSLQLAQESAPRLTRPDRLSQALGTLSQRLRSFDLCDLTVSDDIFLQRPPRSPRSPQQQHEPSPAKKQKITTPPPAAHWPRLETFHLHYPPITPWGEWLFYRSPYIPDGKRMGPAIATGAVQRRYLAAARAALEMPMLRDMTLIAHLESRDQWHKFRYYRDPEKNVARVVWTSSYGFVPDDEVLDAWRAVARKYSSRPDLVVEISNDEHAV